MPNTYAFAFCPPLTIVETVRQLKQQLKHHIGWYHSVNAMAHATIATFKADDQELALAR